MGSLMSFFGIDVYLVRDDWVWSLDAGLGSGGLEGDFAVSRWLSANRHTLGNKSKTYSLPEGSSTLKILLELDMFAVDNGMD